MGIALGAHSRKWGEFSCRSEGLTEGAPDGLMAAYPTRRGIPLPHRLVPVPLHLHPEYLDHHNPAPAAHPRCNQGYKCARSSTIGDQRATKHNDL